MFRTRLRTVLMLIPAVLIVLSLGAARAQDGPVAVIDRLHASLLAVMQAGPSLDFDSRSRQLEPTLSDSYDFPRMAATAAGSYWAGASAAEREQYQEAFTALSIATYASRFTSFAGERFEILGERAGPRGSVLVDTRITPAKGDAVPVTYLLSNRDGQWRIVDVLLDQTISELAVRRSEYAAALKQGGMPKLTSELQSKAANLRTP